MLSDLRESGAIEQDADMVMFIYRPEYYQITEDENGMPLNNQAQIIIAKHRNGSLEDVKLKFEAQYARFSDYESADHVDSTFTSMGEPDAGGNFNSIIRSSRMNDMNDEAPF
jgi:replicative DNA helicase